MSERIMYPITVLGDIELVLGWQASEHFATRREAGLWKLDHLPSGFHIPYAYAATRSEAIEMAKRLEEAADFSKRDSWRYSDEEMGRIRELLGVPSIRQDSPREVRAWMRRPRAAGVPVEEVGT